VNRNSIFILWALHIAPCCISLVQAGTPTLGAKALIGDNQQYRVSARITTGNGVSLSGVSITEKGTKNRVVSAQDGTFRLLVSSSESIVVLSYVGYSPQEYTADRVPQQIILTADAQSLEQVVVTGYQKLDKSRFTGSVSQVEKATIDRSGYVDVSRMLQGAAAGVSVQNVSGTFGSTPKIRIRGNASISANQEPLYVLNGVPITSPANVSVSQLYSGDPASMLGSAIAGLNAQDIEDIVILKDGAATSLYGTRAANGVISIRTKGGKLASKPTVNFNTAISIGQKPTISKYNRMNAAQEMDLYKELFDRGYFSNNNWPSTTGAFTDAYRRYALREINQEQAYEELNRSAQVNTDWFGTLFRNNILQEHSLSFSGGKKRVSYYLSGSYAKDDGQAIGYDMDRITANLQTGIQVTNAFHIDVNANLSTRDQLAPGTYNSGTLYSDVTRNFEISPGGLFLLCSKYKKGRPGTKT
jgi:TonB-dependent SusC/RagA subfamily outer membrane receptor